MIVIDIETGHWYKANVENLMEPPLFKEGDQVRWIAPTATVGPGGAHVAIRQGAVVGVAAVDGQELILRLHNGSFFGWVSADKVCKT